MSASLPLRSASILSINVLPPRSNIIVAEGQSGCELLRDFTIVGHMAEQVDECIGDLPLVEKAMRLRSDDHLSGKAVFRPLDRMD